MSILPGDGTSFTAEKSAKGDMAFAKVNLGKEAIMSGRSTAAKQSTRAIKSICSDFPPTTGRRHSGYSMHCCSL